ncbi:MAG: hypothetical protein JW891_08720 [Candidatus Lokiarchaeota archaeon]|nr:hypothetical protein [Candidatus Lokiarchaeota archaeon]
MTQVFKVNPDGTTTELTADRPIKDIMSTEEVYVIVADDIRKIFLWLGEKSSVRLKFVGAKRSQDIRGQVGLHYGSQSIDEGNEPPELIKLMGGKTEAGIAQEIKSDEGGAPAVNPLRQKAIFDPPRPAEGMNIAGSRDRAATNTGPLYTESGGIYQFVQEDQQVNFDQIMQKLEEIKTPLGYERELIIVGNHAYSIVEKVQTFLGKKQVEKVMEKVGTIPEGVFFAEDYSPRVLSENGKILAIEFLKRQATTSQSKSKSEILKDQIKSQLG